VDYIEEGEYYKIITGERRYQAAKLVHLSAMPCIVLDDVDSKDRYAKQMIENIQREDFTLIDKARALLEYKEMLGDTAPWEEVEKLVGISRRRRQQFLALLNLPENIQKEIVVIGRRPANNQITEKHARALLLLNHLPEKQNELFELIKNAVEPITGDVALEKAKEMQGKKEVHRFSIAYKNERELLQKLEEKVEELKRILEV
jgi:ParB family chromosome partitioning protein